MKMTKDNVVTSQVSSEICSLQSEQGLVPVGDFINHSATPNMRWSWDAVDGSFIVTAVEPVNKGE